MNNDTVYKIKMAIAAIDQNLKMAPHIIAVIKRNITEQSSENVKDFCEAFDCVIRNAQNVPAWMWEVRLLTHQKANA